MERKKLDTATDMQTLVSMMAEGNPGAMNVLISLLSKDHLITLFTLDDMNIRGTQIWLAFKNYCNEDIDALVASTDKHDANMIKSINILNAKQGELFKAVISGANSCISTPVFTSKEIAEFKRMPDIKKERTLGE